MSVDDLVTAIEEMEALDPPAERIAALVGKVAGVGPVKDILSGRLLRHPLHPLLTDAPIGAWGAAMLLDVAGGPGARDAADALVAAGTLAGVPAAASGLSDWADLVGAERRVGLVHAALNVGALTLYAASLMPRRRGARRTGVALTAAGAALAGAAAWLGGHLVYRLGMGVDRNAFTVGPEDWTDAGPADGLPDSALTLREVAGAGVLLYRRDSLVDALGDVCSHQGGPLHEGEVTDTMCVVCPWHGSTFRLTDGAVVRGPATAPQPAYDARIRDGRVEVRRRPREDASS